MTARRYNKLRITNYALRIIRRPPMSDRTRTRLLIALLALSAVLALAGAGLITYARLKG